MGAKPRRFQFSLGRLLGAVALLSAAGAASTAMHDYDPDVGPVMLAAASGLTGAAIGLLFSKRRGLGAAFGATLGLIAFGLLACAAIRAVE